MLHYYEGRRSQRVSFLLRDMQETHIARHILFIPRDPQNGDALAYWVKLNALETLYVIITHSHNGPGNTSVLTNRTRADW